MPDLKWPRDLLRQVAQRNIVLFAGAGVSMSAQDSSGNHPPNWQTLLADLGKHICSETQFTRNVKPLIKQGSFLLAAEYINYIAKQRGDLNGFRDFIVSACDGDAGDEYQPSLLHSRLLDLQPSTIVTTNYDKIFERAAGDGFHALTFEDAGIDNAVRQGKNIILKLHGSTSPGSRLVLSQSDYVYLRRQGALALDVLSSLLLTKMALFIGYSFSDPDLRQILETLYGVPGRGPGHVFVSNGPIPSYQQSLFADAYGLSVITYQKDQHGKLQDALVDLASALA